MKSIDDHAEFERLLRPHLPRLYRLACRLTANRVDAEDLFQDVLTRIYPRIAELQALDAPGTWLARVMYNRFVDDRRRYSRQRLRVVSEAELPDQGIESLASSGDDLHDAVWQEQLQVLAGALAMLAEEQRTVLLLHDAEGYKLTEIQEITGDPLGTVKSRLHRARRRLRDILPDDGTFS